MNAPHLRGRDTRTRRETNGRSAIFFFIIVPLSSRSCRVTHTPTFRVGLVAALHQADRVLGEGFQLADVFGHCVVWEKEKRKVGVKRRRGERNSLPRHSHADPPKMDDDDDDDFATAMPPRHAGPLRPVALNTQGRPPLPERQPALPAPLQQEGAAFALAPAPLPKPSPPAAVPPPAVPRGGGSEAGTSVEETGA